MQKKVYWYRNLRFKLLIALCAITLLASGLFPTRPVFAREVTGNSARPAAAGLVNSRISVVSWGSGRLDIFVVKLDGSIWLRTFDATWYNWVSLGKAPGNFSFNNVDAVSWGANRLDVFGVDNNQTVWHKSWNGSAWSAWENIGGQTGFYQFTNGVQAVSWGSGRIDLFTVKPAGQNFQHKVWSGSGWWPSQTGWETLTANMTGSVHVVSHSFNRLDIFRNSSDPDNYIYRKYWNGTSWKPTLFNSPTWQYMNGQGRNTPFAVSWGTDRIDVFTRGSDGGIWLNNTSNGGTNWSGWNSLGGGSSLTYSEPTAESWGANRLDVFENKDDSGAIYHKWWDGSAWGPAGQTGAWEYMGTVAGTIDAPEVVAWGPVRLDIFLVGTGGELWHKWSNGGAWGPTQETWESLGSP
jgi:hypothetical protein